MLRRAFSSPVISLLDRERGGGAAHLALTTGFSFVARQKRLQIDNNNFYVDPLFYNRRLRRRVAIELKLGEFKAADKGRMELYLRWLASNEQEPGEVPPLGIILCTGKNREQIELLEVDRSGIHVAECLTGLPSRQLLEQKLHEAVTLSKARLENRPGTDRFGPTEPEVKQGRALMRIGYARGSPREQDQAAQSAALSAAGCGRIFEEKASAGRWDRPELSRLPDQLRQDDVLVVWTLDRLSRSLKDMLTLMETVEKAGAGVLSLTEAVDTTSPAGRMMMPIVGSFAEFERARLRERSLSGLLSARREGRIGGRRPTLTPTPQKEIVHPVDSAQKTAADSARLFNAHPSTLARLLARSKLTK